MAISTKYQDLIDAGYDEADIERLVGEGWTVDQIWEQKRVEDGAQFGENEGA